MHPTYRWNGAARRIAMIGNHLPRRCGIATFTTDLAEAIASDRMGSECGVVAMNDPGSHHAYPERVVFAIDEGDPASYRRAADHLNLDGADVVSLQHEYGIFGGPAGVFLLDLVRELRMPLVTTLHTVLANPNASQRAVMDELTTRSDRLVVMSTMGKDLLQRVHRVDSDKIAVIPHGIPNVPLTRASKERLGLQGNDVMLTFGLLSPDKGIENVIDALPRIREERPNVVYVVVGVTHPHVKERDGEAYRSMLEHRAKRIGVDENIVFHDRFVSHDDLVQFLSAADIYVTPYLNSEQITSGTLAYAVGAGKAVISTPYRYACEILDEGRGVLVPPKDPAAIARAALEILTNEPRRRTMEAHASALGRKMTWPIVAQSYLQAFARACADHGRRHEAFRAKTLAKRPAAALPRVDLSHVRLMTDDAGILQHATFNVPRRADGYCLDDNARALLLMTMLEDAGVAADPARSIRSLASRYLSFVDHAFDAERGRFRNFMTYARQWALEPGSDDCHGRALWALGVVGGRSRDRAMRGLAHRLWRDALPAVAELTSPRAWAYTILGVDEFLRSSDGDRDAQRTMEVLSEKLLGLHASVATSVWPWFEDRLTYCNARLAQALLIAGRRLSDERATTTALAALRWLCEVQTRDHLFAPIGSNGFWVRGGPQASHDQQPVEAAATIAACLDAHRATGEASWLAHAKSAFDWLLGANALHLPLFDAATGGCRDGLHADRLNDNEGAESTLSFLLALVDMHVAERVASAPLPVQAPRESSPLGIALA